MRNLYVIIIDYIIADIVKRSFGLDFVRMRFTNDMDDQGQCKSDCKFLCMGISWKSVMKISVSLCSKNFLDLSISIQVDTMRYLITIEKRL